MTQAPKTWAAKDPEARLDYSYRIPLDATDSVSIYDVEKISGDVILESDSLAAAPNTVDGVYGQEVTAWLSGGTDGETAVFRVSWTTLGGREDDAIILLPVSANEPVDLELTGYAKPTAAHLILRYPAFADVQVGTIRAWLADAERSVDESWTEGDYAAGLMALAAHNITVAGMGSEAGALSGVPAGITAMKSGTLSLSFSEGAARDRIAGALASTRYGQEYANLLRRNRAGPRVMATGTVPYDPLVYPHGEA